MISIVAALVMTQAPPPLVDSGAPPRSELAVPAGELPREPHIDRAHRSLRQKVRLKLIPSLRSYKALSNDVVGRLGFLDEVKDIARKLDRFRRHSVTKALEQTVPGFRWITKGWDQLTDMVDQMELVRRTMKRLRRASRDLLKAAERYSNDPSDERFQSLVDGYEDAQKTFKDAKETFKNIRRWLGGANTGLDKTAGVLEDVSGTPWVGRYVDNLGRRVRGLEARIKLLRAVLGIASDAIDRDRGAIKSLVATFREAHAHDAYDAAIGMADAEQPGSALAAFRDLATRWPDTEWAHRSDRRIVELVNYIDQLERDMKSARTEIAALNGELARKPKVVVKTEVKTRVVALQPKPAFAWSAAAGAGAGILCLAALGVAVWRRRRPGPTIGPA